MWRQPRAGISKKTFFSETTIVVYIFFLNHRALLLCTVTAMTKNGKICNKIKEIIFVFILTQALKPKEVMISMSQPEMTAPGTK